MDKASQLDSLFYPRSIAVVGATNASFFGQYPRVLREFGLVMAEAMACGTPVVAFRRGAAAEVVVHGETGYLVNDVDGMVEAVLKVDRIDPARCRRHVVENFGPERMVDGYLRIYQWILDRVAVRPTLTPLAPAAPSLVTEATGQETAVA